jgi:phenylacetate-CoA ligase
VYRWLVPRLVFPLYEGLSGRRLWTEVLRLRELQWRTTEELEARALRKLRALLAHAVLHVPYYRDLYKRAGIRPEDLRTMTDLSRLPITTKADLRNNFPSRTTADNLPATRQWRTLTSGSTGFPFEFYSDAAGADAMLGSYLFFLEWAGAAIWQARVDIGTNANQSFRSIMPSSPKYVRLARRFLLGERFLTLSGIDLTADEFRARMCDLSRRRGYFIRAYPSYAARLAAQLLKERGPLPVSPTVVITGAETLTPMDAATIREAFRCPVVNHYSTWEVPHMAQSCPDVPEMLHVNSERAILRIVREDGSPTAPGERGRMLITALSNYMMPFINYDIGDSGAAGGPCPCGRGFPTLMCLEGRSVEVIRTPAGKIISPVALNQFPPLVRLAVPYIWEYQAVQTAADTVTFLIVPTSRYTSEFARTLQMELERFLGPGVNVHVKTVDRIPAEKSGKRLIIRSHLSGT